MKDPVYWSVPRNRIHDLLLCGQFILALPTELIRLRFYAIFFFHNSNCLGCEWVFVFNVT